MTTTEQAARTRTATLAARLRWKLYGLALRLPDVCPANAHGALIWRTRSLREMAVDGACRRDCAANGSCWCGKLRRQEAAS